MDCSRVEKKTETPTEKLILESHGPGMHVPSLATFHDCGRTTAVVSPDFSLFFDKAWLDKTQEAELEHPSAAVVVNFGAGLELPWLIADRGCQVFCGQKRHPKDAAARTIRSPELDSSWEKSFMIASSLASRRGIRAIRMTQNLPGVGSRRITEFLNNHPVFASSIDLRL